MRFSRKWIVCFIVMTLLMNGTVVSAQTDQAALYEATIQYADGDDADHVRSGFTLPSKTSEGDEITWYWLEGEEQTPISGLNVQVTRTDVVQRKQLLATVDGVQRTLRINILPEEVDELSGLQLFVSKVLNLTKNELVYILFPVNQDSDQIGNTLNGYFNLQNSDTANGIITAFSEVVKNVFPGEVINIEDFFDFAGIVMTAYDLNGEMEALLPEAIGFDTIKNTLNSNLGVSSEDNTGMLAILRLLNFFTTLENHEEEFNYDTYDAFRVLVNKLIEYFGSSLENDLQDYYGDDNMDRLFNMLGYILTNKFDAVEVQKFVEFLDTQSLSTVIDLEQQVFDVSAATYKPVAGEDNELVLTASILGVPVEDFDGFKTVKVSGYADSNSGKISDISFDEDGSTEVELLFEEGTAKTNLSLNHKGTSEKLMFEIGGGKYFKFQHSFEVTGPTPATVPVAPANVTAVAGNGQATVNFTAPVNSGGKPITGYTVTSNPGGITVSGVDSPITVTGLTNGVTYTFTVVATNEVGYSMPSDPSNAITPIAPSSGGSTNSGSTSGNTSPESNQSGVEVLVNGKAENAGTATITKRGEQTVTTITFDPKKLEEKLAAEGQRAVVTLSLTLQSDVVIGELDGQMVKNMEQKQAVLEIKTGNASYTLPAEQIDIDSILRQLGAFASLQDIKIQIEIAAPTAAAVKAIENAAEKGSFELVVPSVDFTVKAVYGDKIVEVSKFTAYVERTIVIPDGIDPNKITTSVVVEADGTVRHVPTEVKRIDGKTYAVINSLTNSTYSVVWHPVEFKDVANHWSKEAVNDMGSRMVIEGTDGGQFSPDRDITRAEFAAIMIRGLGLKLESGGGSFNDVKATDWYSGAIHTAQAYGLIDGYNDGTFRPNSKITREQAMTIIAKAMKLTGLRNKLVAQTAEVTLLSFGDAQAVSTWAKSGVADTVHAGIVSGRSADTLAPKGYMTRAEVAATIQRLLKQSGLI